MNKLIFLLLILMLTVSCKQTKINISSWNSISDQFEKGYTDLNIAPLQIGYIDNLKSILKMDKVSKQESFFLSVQKSIKKVDVKKLSEQDRLDYALIQYETQLNLERIILEKKWLALNIDTISQAGLSTVPNGKDWYAYYLKKWVDIEVTPKSMYAFGLKEIEKVKSNIKKIQLKSGMDSLAFHKHINSSQFFYTSTQEIENDFKYTKELVSKKLNKYFPFMDLIPDVKIKRGTNIALSKVPAFYIETEGTFYYNYFDIPFNKRQIKWIYIHEAIPGHHYQLTLDKVLPRSSIQQLFVYSGYIEGYAAYVEEIGYEIGAYENMYDELGKWEWDLIRSVRVCLDVGLNYYGWSDDKALAFWQKYIENKDDIAKREIARMKRWPAQVITYKYGANKILEWRFSGKLSQPAGLKAFHENILKRGDVPFSVLNNYN